MRSIVATSDVRAQARYYAAGTVARFPIYTLAAAFGEAETACGGGMAAVPIDDARAIEKQRAIERHVLGHRRSDEEMRWLLEHRRAHLYQRDAETIGFSFVGGDGVGPVAALALAPGVGGLRFMRPTWQIARVSPASWPTAASLPKSARSARANAGARSCAE